MSTEKQFFGVRPATPDATDLTLSDLPDMLQELAEQANCNGAAMLSFLISMAADEARKVNDQPQS